MWISVVNDRVTFNDAESLWGLDTQETQEALMPQMVHDYHAGDWNTIASGWRDAGKTTQRPAILTTGPNPENYGPLSSLVSDMAHVIGQGGFGGVWAAKNLKAIGFLGTKSIEIADPQAMMDARLWAQQYTWGGHVDNPNKYIGMQDISSPPGNSTRFYGTGVSRGPMAA